MNNFNSVNDIAIYLRNELETKNYLLLFAYNGTGKTRLSMAFKDIGKSRIESAMVDDELNIDRETYSERYKSDTLYFNAFTEDLFNWDNDLEEDSIRTLKLNSKSKFFAGLKDLEIESRIQKFLHRYADFDFNIDYEKFIIVFSRNINNGKENISHIKISRGEENLFIWCFFLAIVQLAIDKAESYAWVKYVFIDDPISSLDENNAIAIAHNLAQLIKKDNKSQNNKSSLKIIISTHHTLFFNVLCNEFKNQFIKKAKTADKYFLSYNKKNNSYDLKNINETPSFYHIAMLAELKKAASSEKLYTYHFSILRSILEKTASFLGHSNFAECIKQVEGDEDGILYKRIIDIMNHGNYSHFEPIEMVNENKEYFKNILENFIRDYNFNDKIL